MAIVRYPKHGVEADVPPGTSILEASRQAGVPNGSACGGVCACSTCHVYVAVGAELLTEADDCEQDILDKAFDVRRNSRLGCQARVARDGVVEVELSRESVATWHDEHPDVRPPRAAPT